MAEEPEQSRRESEEGDVVEGDSPRSSAAGDVGGMSPASSADLDPQPGSARNVPKSRSMLHVRYLYSFIPLYRNDSLNLRNTSMRWHARSRTSLAFAILILAAVES